MKTFLFSISGFVLLLASLLRTASEELGQDRNLAMSNNHALPDASKENLMFFTKGRTLREKRAFGNW